MILSICRAFQAPGTGSNPVRLAGSSQLGDADLGLTETESRAVMLYEREEGKPAL